MRLQRKALLLLVQIGIVALPLVILLLFGAFSYQQILVAAAPNQSAMFHQLWWVAGALLAGTALGSIAILWVLHQLWIRAERFREIVETTEEWVWTCDATGHLTYSNSAVEGILAYTRMDVLGKNLTDFIFEEDLPRFRTEIFSQSVERRTGWTNLVLRRNHRQGGICYLESSAVPVLGPDGTVQGFRGTDRDVTDRKMIEQQLEMSRDAALRSARAKSDFLAVMSHEIRTPLNGVIGMTSVLSGTSLSEFQKDCLKTIKISGESLLSIIDDILNFSKIESGRLQLDQRLFALEQCVEETLDFFIAPIKEKGLNVIVKKDPEVPSLLIGDAGRLRQILGNLLSNAVKFTARGSITLHIARLKAVGDEEQLQFMVQDTGIGIPEQAIPLLFQSFQQVDSSASRNFGGTGLGLAISKKLAELMRGTMWVESREGEGSSFFFTAIFKASPDFGKGKEVPTPASPLSMPSPPDSAGKPNDRPAWRILLAEDNEINQKVLLMLLQALGHRADLVTNGMEVLAAVEKEDYDLVLMDVQMPHMDGIEATRRIQDKMGQDSPYIVALTANALEGDRERFLSLGFDSYVSKPIEMETLAQIFEKLLRRPVS